MNRKLKYSDLINHSFKQTLEIDTTGKTGKELEIVTIIQEPVRSFYLVTLEKRDQEPQSFEFKDLKVAVDFYNVCDKQELK